MEPTVLDTKKSKKKVWIILGIAIFLAIAGIATAVYYFQIADLAPDDSNASEGCACYFVKATDTVKSCNDATPSMAFEFRTGTKKADGTCSALCEVTTASKISSTTTPTVLSCKLDSFNSTYGCVDISMSQTEGERIANEVDPSKDVNLIAKFSSSPTVKEDETFYSNFTFIINGERTEIPVAQASTTGEGSNKTYEVTTKVSDLASADKLTVQALGTTTSGSALTSDACLRTVSVIKSTTAMCTDIDAEIIRTTTNKPKVNEVSLTTSAVSSPSTVSIKFTVGSSNQTLTTKNVVSKFSNGIILLNQSFLYNSSNFVDGKSFSILDSATENIKIAAEIYINGNKISSGACSQTFEIPAIDDSGKTPTDDNDDDETPAPTTDDTSDFDVTVTTPQTCSERVSPDNVVTYTITTRNNDSDTETITRIENKLPLGFRYKTGSTYVNGSLVSDSSYVTTSLTGSTQTVKFTKTGGFVVSSGQSLVIRFSSYGTTTALTGTNINEALAIPVNTPSNSTSVRDSVTFTVAQNCTSPETGIFDSTIAKVILGIIILVLGFILYFSQSGLFVSQKFLSIGVVKKVRNTSNIIHTKITNPRKYFEEEIVRKIDKD